uniref:Uncharacterized protein n=1 Tax=Paenibacillus polymyxa TaxID=1406 RepID=A0AAE9PS39_PAEPO
MTKSTLCMHPCSRIRAAGALHAQHSFLKWGDFMDPAVSSGAVHLNLKKR